MCFRDFRVSIIVFLGCMWVYLCIANFPNPPKIVNQYQEIGSVKPANPKFWLEWQSQEMYKTNVTTTQKQNELVPKQMIENPSNARNSNGKYICICSDLSIVVN